MTGLPYGQSALGTPMAKKRRLDDYPIFGTKDMIEGYLRILRRDSRRHWDALTIWEIPEDEGTDTDEGH